MRKIKKNYTIDIEDDEPLDAEFDFILPFSVESDEGGAHITVSRSMKDLAQRYASAADEGCSQEQLCELVYGYLHGALAGSEYAPDREAIFDCTVTYLLTPEDAVCMPPQKTVRMTRAELDKIYEAGLCDAEYEPDEVQDDETDRSPVYAVKDGDRILSLAAVNGMAGEGGSAEIFYATAERAQGKGYATAAAAALIRELTKSGKTVSLVCFSGNKASVAVAEKIGFKMKSTRIDGICRRS